MGQRVPGRSDQLAIKGPSIILVGARPEDPLGHVLKKAFAGARFSHNPPTSLFTPADIAVGIFERSDGYARLAFTRWARDEGVPALCVEIRDNEVLIGPLALPGRAGCGRCAVERLTAASATAEPRSQRVVAADEVAVVAARVLVNQVEEIIRAGPERSELLDHIMAIDAELLETSLHQVIPLSRCSVCGGAAAFPRVTQARQQFSPEDSPEILLQALAGWVDQRTGVISNLYIEPPDELGVELPIIATAAPPHVFANDGSLRRLPLGWGKGLTVSGAVLSAVGEAIERYSASLPDPDRIVWERPDDLEGEFLDPRAFAFYTSAQYEREGFPYVRFDPGICHPWVLGKWLNNGAPVWLPAVFTFLSFTLRPEQLICQGTSNGLAASTDDEDATLRATLELIERDAFMAAWLTASPGRRVELDDTLDPLLRKVLDGVEGLGATIEVYLLPTSVCGTTAMCIGLGDGEQYPGATIGLGADSDPRAALRQAILELGQTGPYLRRMMRSNTLPVPDKPASVQKMLDHASYYFPRERAAAFNRLRSQESPLALRDLGEGPTRSLASCASELAGANVRIALVDVTSADVATGPFTVVRAVSPDLQSISYGYGLELDPVERIRALKLADEMPAIHPIW